MAAEWSSRHQESKQLGAEKLIEVVIFQHFVLLLRIICCTFIVKLVYVCIEVEIPNEDNHLSDMVSSFHQFVR